MLSLKDVIYLKALFKDNLIPHVNVDWVSESLSVCVCVCPFCLSDMTLTDGGEVGGRRGLRRGVIPSLCIKETPSVDWTTVFGVM